MRGRQVAGSNRFGNVKTGTTLVVIQGPSPIMVDIPPHFWSAPFNALRSSFRGTLVMFSAHVLTARATPESCSTGGPSHLTAKT